MTRRMSCSFTIDAVRSHAKTVTRRHPLTWANLTYDDRLTLIEKGMGLPKGAKQVVLAEVEIVDVRVEPIEWIHSEPDGCAREGLPHLSPAEFVEFWCRSHGFANALAGSDSLLPFRLLYPVFCRRIEWRYLDEVAA